MDMDVDVFGWYRTLPPVTKVFLTGVALVSIGCSLEVLRPVDLLLNWHMIREGEFWRLVTTFMYFGPIGINWLLYIYFLTRHCERLEEDVFFHQPAEFLWFLLVCMSALLVASRWTHALVLSYSLTNAITYLWSRHNPNVQMAFFGVIVFPATYLPWIYVAFSASNSNALYSELLAIGIAHSYYFLNSVFPVLADCRGWRIRKPFGAPSILKRLLHDQLLDDAHDRIHLQFDVPNEGAAAGALAADAPAAVAHADDGGAPAQVVQDPPAAMAAEREQQPQAAAVDQR